MPGLTPLELGTLPDGAGGMTRRQAFFACDDNFTKLEQAISNTAELAAFAEGNYATAWIDPINGNDANDGTRFSPWETAAKAYAENRTVWFIFPGDAGSVDMVAGKRDDLIIKGVSAVSVTSAGVGFDQILTQVTIRNQAFTSDHLHIYSDYTVLIHLEGGGDGETQLGPDLTVFNAIVGDVVIIGTPGVDGIDDGNGNITGGFPGGDGGLLSLQACRVYGSITITPGAASLGHPAGIANVIMSHTSCYGVVNISPLAGFNAFACNFSTAFTRHPFFRLTHCLVGTAPFVGKYSLPAEPGTLGQGLKYDATGNLVNANLGGKVQQMVHTLVSDASATAVNGVWTNAIFMNITMANAGDNVVISSTLQVGTLAGGTVLFRVTRAGTMIDQPTSPGSRIPCHASVGVAASGGLCGASLTVVDAPGAGTHTYAVQFRTLSTAATAFLNRSSTDTDLATFARGATILTLMEVAP